MTTVHLADNLPEPDFTLRIPRCADWINANNRRRMHWSVDRALTHTWRYAASVYARNEHLPALGPSRVVAELWVNGRRRARIDPANYSPTAKAVVDGLVDAGIWPDDNAGWVVGPDMRLGPPVKPPQPEALVVHIWGGPCCDGAHNRHGHREVAS